MTLAQELRDLLGKPLLPHLPSPGITIADLTVYPDGSFITNTFLDSRLIVRWIDYGKIAGIIGKYKADCKT